MKKAKKGLLLVLCAVLLVGATIAGTVAYLTAQDVVENTFTVGKVALTLDEAKVDEYGVPVTDAERVDSNTYKLIPGKEYTKDPIVHVDPVSENCWVFIKVENAIAAYEAAGETTIAAQIVANGWTALHGVGGVYYKEYTKDQSDKELEVFGKFVVAADAEKVAGWDTISTTATKVKVTAYAIQKEGFSTADTAWGELNKAAS